MDPFIIANFIPCFHCVKLYYSALMQLHARARARRSLLGLNGAHRFSLTLDQFLVYINVDRRDSSSRALVRNKSNSVANGSLFLSLSPFRARGTRTHVHYRHTP